MFQPRPYFPFPTNLPSWFVGHMHKALGVMDQKLASMDLFVEVRDARLPLSSINPAFERLSGPEKRARRLIVYTKRDLADNRFEQVRSAQPMGHFSFNPTVQLAILNIEHIIQPLKQAFDRHNADTVLFANARNDQDARKVLKHILRELRRFREGDSRPHGPLWLLTLCILPLRAGPSVSDKIRPQSKCTKRDDGRHAQRRQVQSSERTSARRRSKG